MQEGSNIHVPLTLGGLIMSRRGPTYMYHLPWAVSLCAGGVRHTCTTYLGPSHYVQEGYDIHVPLTLGGLIKCRRGPTYMYHLPWAVSLCAGGVQHTWTTYLGRSHYVQEESDIHVPLTLGGLIMCRRGPTYMYHLPWAVSLSAGGIRHTCTTYLGRSQYVQEGSDIHVPLTLGGLIMCRRGPTYMYHLPWAVSLCAGGVRHTCTTYLGRSQAFKVGNQY